MAMLKRFAELTLHWKLALVTVLTTVVALLFAAVLMMAYDARTAGRQAVESANAQAQVLAASVYASLVFEDPDSANEYLAASAANPAMDAAAVYSGNGRVIASYLRPGSAPLPEKAGPTGATLTGEHVSVVVPVLDSEQGEVGAVYLRAKVEPLSARLLRFGSMALLITFGALAIVVPFAVRILRNIANPFEELAEKTAIIDTTMQAVDHGIVVVDADMQVSYVNSRLQQILPECRDVAVGMDFRDFMRRFVPGTGRNVDVELARLYSKDRTVTELVSADGKKIEVRQSPLRHGGFVRTVTDVSEAKALQEQLERAKERAEAADKAKSAFLAAMSHEIRTPMNGVIGLVELLRSTRLADDQRQMVEIIRQSGVSLLDVINDILDYSKIEAGRMTVEKTEFNLREVIETTAEVVGGHTSSKFLDVVCSVDPELDEMVIGDPVRLRQVILNIMGNAVKFTSRGLISVTAEAVSVSDSVASVMFAVSDTGLGIDEEKQKKLFRPFSQADYSTTRKFGGTGLGLSISKNLIELMGGEIGVKSTPGKGSTFWFQIPFGRVAPELRAAPLTAAHQALAGLRVLVCDDLGPDVAATLYLRAAGVEVTEVGSNAPVTTLLRQQRDTGQPFDLVLVNVRVGDDSAAQVVTSIRSQSDLAATKLALVVPHLSAGAARLAATTLACPSIPAPLRRDKLVATVAAITGRSSEAIVVKADESVLGYVAPSIEAAAAAHCLILVAEDNRTNQFVIRSQLARLGFAAEFVGDGREGWEMLSKHDGRYGLLLTDCHMPFLDGYQLTGLIRDRELQSRKRLPVIALTANALQGEREICRAAGMDDYLSKPTDLKTLETTLLRWLPGLEDLRRPADPQHNSTARDAAALPPLADPAPAGDTAPVDLAGLATLVGSSEPGYLNEILTMFWDDMHQTPRELQGLHQARDSEALAKAAHAAKGAAASACARALASLLYELESNAKRGAWHTVDILMPPIVQAFADLERFIREQTGGALAEPQREAGE
ncbi:MAG: ATP-binding protein [Rhodospirillaceae bacterium]